MDPNMQVCSGHSIFIDPQVVVKMLWAIAFVLTGKF